jgi:hypothetical protein
MRRFRVSELLIGFLLGFAALLVIFLLSSDIAAHYEVCETTKEGAKECARYGVVHFALHGIGAALDSCNGLITAIATIFIAWFTFSLRRSTDKLWDAGERQRELAENTAERQLRAYVSVDGDASRERIIEPFKGIIQIPLKIINLGQTPAYRLTRWSNIEILPYPLTVTLAGMPQPIPDQLPTSNLGPGAPIGMIAGRSKVWTPQEVLGTIDGTMRIYIYGEVHYFDVFKNPRCTKFRNMLRVLPDGGTGNVQLCEEGNEAS